MRTAGGSDLAREVPSAAFYDSHQMSTKADTAFADPNRQKPRQNPAAQQA